MLAVGSDCGSNLAEDPRTFSPWGRNNIRWLSGCWTRGRNPLSYCSNSTAQVPSIVLSSIPLQQFAEEFSNKKTINLDPKANWNQ